MDNDKPLSKANEFAFVKRPMVPAVLSLLTNVIRKNGGFKTEGLFRIASDVGASVQAGDTSRASCTCSGCFLCALFPNP